MNRKRTDCGGWFDIEQAVEVAVEDSFFDGNNNIGVSSGSQCGRDCLIQTAAGAYVIHYSRQWQDCFRVVSKAEAAKWILRNTCEDPLPDDLAEFADEGMV